MWAVASGLPPPSSAHPQFSAALGEASSTPVDIQPQEAAPHSVLHPPLIPGSVYTGSIAHLSHTGPGGAGVSVWEFRVQGLDPQSMLEAWGKAQALGGSVPLTHLVPWGRLGQGRSVKEQSRAL